MLSKKNQKALWIVASIIIVVSMVLSLVLQFNSIGI